MSTSAPTKSLPPLPSLREILRLYSLRASKQLSQNFLLDLRITDKIVKSTHTNWEEKTAVEIGPGPGPLTRSLLNANVRKLIAVEKDERFFPALQMLSQAAEGRMHIVHGDILEVKEFDLLNYFSREKFNTEVTREEQERRWKAESEFVFVGNLPFGISTPLLIKWMRQLSERSGAFSFGRTEMLLMFQKEVGEKIAAKCAQKDYGRLSVACQNYCHVEYLFDVKGKTFIPPPKVDAAVLHLKPRMEPHVDIPLGELEEFCRILFSARRKQLQSSMKKYLKNDHIDEIAERFLVHPRKTVLSTYLTTNEVLRRRPQDFQVEEICILAKEYQKVKEKYKLGIRD